MPNPKHIMQCWRCRMPIAGFGELTVPITVDQFVDWHPEGVLPRKFGGEKGTWETFTCTRCGVLQFPPRPGEGMKEREPPEVIRIDWTGDPGKDFYRIGSSEDARPEKQFKCHLCDFSTDFKNSLQRHIRTQH